MRTAIATHELLPKGLDLQTLRIETGRVSICGITTVWWTCFRYATATSFIRRSS